MNSDGSDPVELPGLPADVDRHVVATDPDRGAPSTDAGPDGRPAAGQGQDIGLGFPVCDVTSVAGEFAPGVAGTAYVATKMSDLGRCPNSGTGRAFQIVAVDVTGDGVADADFGPLECDPFCTAFAAPDVDVDGTDELLVQNIQFSIAGLRLYDGASRPGGGLPRDRVDAGLPGGRARTRAEPQLWIGGDAFDSDTLRCRRRRPDGRVLVQTSAVARARRHRRTRSGRPRETVFALNADGTIAVVSSGTFDEPVEAEAASFVAPGDGVCGARAPVASRGEATQRARGRAR